MTRARLPLIWATIGLAVGLMATPHGSANEIRPLTGALIGAAIGGALLLRAIRRDRARGWR